jgi:hypothetical protein
MRPTRLTRVTDALVLAGWGGLVVTVVNRRLMFHLLDLFVHARRDKRLGWG